MLEFEPPCGHKEGRFKCCTIPVYHLIRNRMKVYRHLNKLQQDRILSSFLVVSSPKRRRPRKEDGKLKALTTKFQVRVDNIQVPVCSKFFRALFGIGTTRLNSIASSVVAGNAICEKRGGDRRTKQNFAKKNSVIQFIANLEARESHYNRQKSKRLYLSSDLNITKLFKMYNESVPDSLKVKKWFFSNIFSKKFNLGFGDPAVDVCSYCCRMKHEIKLTKELAKRQRARAELAAHKMRAKQFYKIMKEKLPNSLSLCFDLQQVQPLPKLAIGEAYYARKLSYYALCITDTDNKSPNFYCWTEDQAGRGSNEVASALIDALSKHGYEENTSTLRLFCDGCAGQNRNAHVVHALYWWLLKKSPDSLKEIRITFPVRGHSYLPADRLFGTVEKSLRKQSEILTPEQYHRIYQKMGNVRRLGIDWDVLNFKDLCQNLKKPVGIRDMKRVILKKKLKGKSIRVVFRMEPSYGLDDPSKSYMTLLKRGVATDQILHPNVVSLVHPIKSEKKKDLFDLLKKRFGNNWNEDDSLKFYVDIFQRDCVVANVEDEAEDVECDCLEEEPGYQML